ncbi:hypothetical protein BBP40_012464 [Aspergillus hancockii]|nr:hypothetical protein BBP40_012464 [Aspergillus hancockii]
MSSVNLNGKRRRVETAASALSKPFKSPLRRPPQVSETKHEALPNQDDNASPKPVLKHNIVDKRDARNQPETSTSTTPTCPSVYSTSISPSSSLETRKRKLHVNHLASPKKPIFSDPAVLDLQKQQRALQSRLATLRSELDTAQQALRLESSTKDAEIESLIVKWRSISQNAAEEVFSGAQERVARMGGLKIWKERMKSNSVNWEEEEIETGYGSVETEGGDVDEDEPRDRKAAMQGQSGVREKSDDGERESKENEDEEFTMDYMLKTLNIDHKVIGYDKAHQTWIKN